MTFVPQTIKKRSEFLKIGKFGARAKTGLLSVVCLKTGNESFVGYTASRKVGNAVVRNKAKRRLRSLVRRFSDGFIFGYEFVLIANGQTAECLFLNLEQDFLYCIKRAMKRASENENCC